MTTTIPENIQQALADFAYIHPQIVAWGEMDAFNHVNNVVFYRYIESARISYLKTLNMMDVDNIIVLASSSCTYLKPVEYPDTLYVGVRISRLGNSSFTTEYGLYSQAQAAIVATAEAVVVSLNADASASQPLDAATKDRIIQSEQAVGNNLA